MDNSKAGSGSEPEIIERSRASWSQREMCIRDRMEGAGDARGQAVELHADEAAARKRLRHGGEERARAA